MFATRPSEPPPGSEAGHPLGNLGMSKTRQEWWLAWLPVISSFPNKELWNQREVALELSLRNIT